MTSCIGSGSQKRRMQITSVQTNIGAAAVIKFSPPIHPIESFTGFGAILWGRSSRTDLLTVALNLKGAIWIADYDPNLKCAIVCWSDCEDIGIGSGVVFDTTLVPADAICPYCGSTKYVGNGRSWLCKDCNKQWAKNPKRSISSAK